MLNQKVCECLRNVRGSYFLPLLWYAGEGKKQLCEEIRAVKDSGMDEFVLENRGGDWFCREPWWDIMGCALETARELNMRLWVLDDSHVNTGSANDSLSREENAQFRPLNLRIEAADLIGPVHGGALILPNHTEAERVIQVTAYRRDENTGSSVGEPVVLTGRIADGLCALDLPAGIWRVYFILTADPSRLGLFANYITMVSKASCRHLIDEVHEKIYEHFSEYFGNTFAGFFSDEPAFGNCDGQYGHDSCDHRMGQLRRLYPWQDDFPAKIAAASGLSEAEVTANLPALWDEVEGRSPAMRVVYMDVITQAWRENFSCQIGQWCEAHGVEYIGHCLEDRGAHFHTGWGCGHYFRAMAGQHMAGLDIVLNQLVPGIRTIRHAGNSSSREYDSVFYNYTLGKLGASLAHVTPHMKNRVFCEVFGAYGWTCGAAMMQAIFNHFLVNGTNYFMPHAFSMNLPGESRKSDENSFVPPGYCMEKLPPTFFMGGLNPQFRLFGHLVQSIQRICHLLSDGVHQADAAVFYNAEADWINGRFQNLDEVAMALTRGGVDYDFLPSDVLYGSCRVEDGRLLVHQEHYGALIVPYSEILPRKLLARLHDLAAAGLKVIFCDSLPSSCEISGCDISGLLTGFSTAATSDLASYLAQILPLQFTAERPSDGLRFYHLAKSDGSHIFLFYNDSIGTLDTFIQLRDGKNWAFYDAWKNRLYAPEIRSGKVRLKLNRQQLVTLVSDADPAAELPRFDYADQPMRELPLKYDISMREAGKDADFKLILKNSDPVNLLTELNLTRCCAEFHYESSFELDDPSFAVLEIPNAGDGAELRINGEYCGSAIGPVCRFEIAGRLKKGRNTITIQTADNPSYSDRTVRQGIVYGTKLPAAPHGFTGNIKIG